MDLNNALKNISTLSEARKKELLEKHLSGTLTEEDKADLKAHMIKALVRLKDEMTAMEALMK